MDKAFSMEISNLANHVRYSSGYSAVPCAFVPKRTEDDKKSAERGRLLAGKERESGAAAKLALESSTEPQIEKPKPGDPVNEHTPGFWAFCYPECYPFGIGCYNDPRMKDITLDEYVSWIMFQVTIADIDCPQPVTGSGDMVHMTHKLLPFHLLNFHLRSQCDSISRSFVRQLPGGGYDKHQIGEHLKSCDAAQLQKQLLSNGHSIVNSAPWFYKGERS